MMIHEVLVPLDFSDQADRALPVARAVADQLGAHLAAVVVRDVGIDADVDAREARLRARRAGCELDRVVLRADDDVPAALLAAAPPPGSALCLATRARGAAAGLVRHSVAEEVISRSRTPVLAVGPALPPGPAAPVERIVCCVGTSDDVVTDRLLDTTAAWAAALGCESHLIRVVAPHPGASALDARERLDDIARRLWARGQLATSALVIDDDVAAGIVRVLGRRPGTLGVVASQGRSGRQRLALGSVTLDVLRRAPTPLLVVPAHAAAAQPTPDRPLAAAIG